MSKSGRQYADDVRELRAAGFDFPASRGYRLADAASWSSGLKSAVTRAVNKLESTDVDVEDFDAPESDFEIIAGEMFADGAGDEFEEWDDIEYFDDVEADDIDDADSDTYEEVT